MRAIGVLVRQVLFEYQADRAERLHTPVLLRETLDLLAPTPGKTYFDATLGMGGHAEAVLEIPGTMLIGVDQDGEAIELAAKQLHRFGSRATLIRSNFSEIKRVLAD